MLSPAIHRYIFLFGIIGLAVGMMFGTVPTSIPQIILAANWLLEAGFIDKWNKIKTNKIFWLIISVFVMHAVGMIHTTDVGRGLDDLRTKAPLFILPVIFFTTKPLTKDELNLLLKFFIWAVLLSTAWCLVYSYTHELQDIRKASRYMSHIRFGLYINFCIGVLAYIFTKLKNQLFRMLVLIGIFYLLFVMVNLSMITGLIIFGIVLMAWLVKYFMGVGKTAGITVTALLLILIVMAGWWVKHEWSEFNFVDTSRGNQQKDLTQSGRKYYPADSLNYHTENGFYITRNIQYDELGLAWKKRSNLDLYGYNSEGILVAWNVIRYMSSKGLTKDSAGVAALSETDIKNIEAGINNYKLAEASPIRIRLNEFFWEYRDYDMGKNPSGNTLLMRLEFWKAAKYIIARNPWFGVGTGDAQRAFNKAYSRTSSKLVHEWRLRSHNQFLAITVSFGIIGLLIFLISLTYPVIALKSKLHSLYYLFFAIALISFITEDTLETQAGLSFFAFFNTLFLWLGSANESKEN